MIAKRAANLPARSRAILCSAALPALGEERLVTHCGVSDRRCGWVRMHPCTRKAAYSDKAPPSLQLNQRR